MVSKRKNESVRSNRPCFGWISKRGKSVPASASIIGVDITTARRPFDTLVDAIVGEQEQLKCGSSQQRTFMRWP